MEGHQSRMLGWGRVLVCYGKVKPTAMVYEALQPLECRACGRTILTSELFTRGLAGVVLCDFCQVVDEPYDDEWELGIGGDGDEPRRWHPRQLQEVNDMLVRQGFPQEQVRREDWDRALDRVWSAEGRGLPNTEPKSGGRPNKQRTAVSHWARVQRNAALLKSASIERGLRAKST